MQMQPYYDKELGEVIVPPGACPFPIEDDDGTPKQAAARIRKFVKSRARALRDAT